MGPSAANPNSADSGRSRASRAAVPAMSGRVLIITVDPAQQQPNAREHRGGDDRRLARSVDLQRLDDRSGGGAVVVGGRRLRRQGGRGLGRPRGARACEQGGIGRLGADRRLEGRGERAGGGRRGLGRGGGSSLRFVGRGGDRFRFEVEVQRVFDRQHRLRDGIRSRIVLRHESASSSIACRSRRPATSSLSRAAQGPRAAS